MKVTTERQENCIVQLTISVDEPKETEYLRRSARALSRNYRIRGFRPGKAPYNVIVQRLGLDMVRAQVIEQFGDEVFEEGLKESGLELVAQASLEDVTWEPMTLHLKAPVSPDVTLGDYRDMRITWGVPEVEEEQIEEELLRLQKEQSEWRPDDRPAELGDQVVLNITGKVEGEVVIENTDREMILNADSPYPVPGFAEAVVGMKPEESKTVTLSYPEDHYNAEIAGKDGEFEIVLNEIRVEVLPELDDEFAMIVGDYENLEELKASVVSSLQEQALNRAEQEYEEQIWERLLETATIEYPLVMVDREVEALQSQLAQRLQQQGMDLDSYYKLANTSAEAWAQDARPQAEDRLKRQLLLGEVIAQEELTAEPEQVDREIDEMIEPLGEQGEQLREMFTSPVGRMSFVERILTRKAIDRLKAIARGEEPAKGNLEPEPVDEAEAALDAEAEDTEVESVAELPVDSADADAEAKEAEAEQAEDAEEAESEDAEAEKAQVADAEAEEPDDAEAEDADKAEDTEE